MKEKTALGLATVGITEAVLTVENIRREREQTIRDDGGVDTTSLPQITHALLAVLALVERLEVAE